MPRPFHTIESVQPRRSVFDLSYSKLFTCDMGQLIPVACDEMVPGDKFSIGMEAVVRTQPLVSPVLHEINIYTHYWFVPYRLLWDGWEDFISGGVDGDDASVLPRWEVTTTPPAKNAVESLWDYFGFPVDVDPDGAYPLDFPRRAYNLIYNEFYRDENLITEVALTNEDVLKRAWTKDYFTSALLTQQRGTAPALPVTIGGTGAVTWDNANAPGIVCFEGDGTVYLIGSTDAGGVVTQLQIGGNNPRGPLPLETRFNMQASLDGHSSIDFSDATATTFDVSDLRLAFQIQKWMERNARGGVRYTEFLRSHFGVSPRDERLQRPEYIGGAKMPLIVSEVLQTSKTDTGTDPSPQGNMAGHGISVNQEFCGKYFATEYGLVMGIMSILPVPMYMQGINRQWLRRSRYDFYFPEFANLSEQAIEQAEIFASDDDSENTGIFGYQGRYDEMRYKPNMVCGHMRDDFTFWHLGRIFSDTPAPPALNEEFITCDPDKRIFAVENEPGFFVHYGNRIKAIRPIPVSSEPGLIDHN